MIPRFTSTEVRNAVGLLASRSLARLVAEIDDNGAIPARRLAATFPDLSTHQLRRATESARAHDLVRTASGTGLELTESGLELADLYDAAARWGRRHSYPAPVCEFSSRICNVLDLFALSLATERTDSVSQPSVARPPGADADQDGLVHPRALLIQWLSSNPQFTRASRFESVA